MAKQPQAPVPVRKEQMHFNDLADALHPAGGSAARGVAPTLADGDLIDELTRF